MSEPLQNIETETLYMQPEQANMDLIADGLYLGNLHAANGAGWLVSQGITHVLSLTSEAVQIPAWTGIVHKQYRVRDNRRQNLLVQVLDGVQFIEDAFTGVLPTHAVGNPAEPDKRMGLAEREVKVFVHCRMGISRSGSIIVAYIMKHHGKTFGNALDFVRNRRRMVHPNQAFVAQLMLLESTGFDISHLGEDLLNPNIENPYDPNEFEERPRRRRSKENEAAKLIKTTMVSKKEEQYIPVAFASGEDHETFKGCVEEVEPLIQAGEERWKKVFEIARGLEAAVTAQLNMYGPEYNRKLTDSTNTITAVRDRKVKQRDHEAAKVVAPAPEAASSALAIPTDDTDMNDAPPLVPEQNPSRARPHGDTHN
ncbi:protein-tyrosine phosphatase-like protein [Tricharina praecox]|uniref:protein-tyrosine phosphatase-like protein n=1 Tax=Tricharina praecox TaxID=43433 RepID=UPI00221F0176|nr:protein-tyrosine phosphatase-like protein [Tricharina praecox]KAI5842821.1 protein-tyrosine phosphatase-like protein [Tricharina praecox]